MKFADNRFELSRDDASLVGLSPYQTVGWDELYDLWAHTWVAYEVAVSCVWHCFDASLEAGTPLNETMKDDEVGSFDSWALGKLSLFLERVIGDE